MARTNGRRLTILFCLLTITESTYPQITCTFAGSCILPCNIQTNQGEELIHWYNLKNNDNPVHSYYDNADQLEYQDKRYARRTSLFNDQITSGNASLKLSDVQVQDEGTYKCYTSTSKGNDEKYVDVKVVAPVQSVDITVTEDSLTCSSKGIYPAPSLTWTTVPNSAVTPEKAPDTQANAQGLYTISGSVKSSDNHTFVCKITAGASTRRASRRQQSLIAEGEAVTIPCTVPEQNLKDFKLTWYYNDDTIILTFNSTSTSLHVDEQWENRMEYTPQQTSIKLQKLQSDSWDGKYTCEVITPDLKHLQLTSISSVTGLGRQEDQSAAVAVGITVAIAGVLFAFAFGFLVWRKKLCFNKEDNSVV